MFEEAFIPNEEDMKELIENVKAKFAFIDGAKASITSLSDILEGIKPAPTLSINIGETKYTEARTVKIIDLSWYTEFKGIGDAILTGFIYVSFLVRYFGNLPSLLSGVGTVVTTVTTKGGEQ